MGRTTTRRKHRSLFRSKALLRCFLFAVLFCLMFAVARWWYHSYETYQEAQVFLEQAQSRFDRVSKELADIEVRKKLLELNTGKIDYLVERKGLIKEGERVLILVRSTHEAVRPPAEKKPDVAWWKWW